MVQQLRIFFLPARKQNVSFKLVSINEDEVNFEGFLGWDIKLMIAAAGTTAMRNYFNNIRATCFFRLANSFFNTSISVWSCK